MSTIKLRVSSLYTSHDSFAYLLEKLSICFISTLFTVLAFLAMFTHLTHDGTTRCNPYRNQIDYIIIKNILKVFSKNSIQTDHKLVKATLKLDWYRMKQQKLNPKSTGGCFPSPPPVRFLADNF